MPEIKLDGDIIKVIFSQNEKSLALQSSRMFRLVLGFEKSVDGLSFTKETSDITDLNSSLAAIKDYFKRGSKDYRSDEAAKKAIGDITVLRETREKCVSGQVAKVDWNNVKPTEFCRNLLPYQVDPTEHMISFAHVADFSVPGSGKTTVAYAAFSALKKRGEVEKLLVICPKSAFQPWEEEYEGCFDRPAEAQIKRIVGNAAAREAICLEESDVYDIFLISYGAMRNDVHLLSRLMQKYPTMLLLDESHKIKGYGGVTSRECLSLAPYAKKRVILTGTPVTNNLMDLWTQMTFLWPDEGLFGRIGNYEQKVSSEGGLKWATSVLKPFYRRIKKGDLHLPKPRSYALRVPMGKKQERIYRSIVGKICCQLDKPDEQITIFEWRRAMMIRLMQAASNPSLLMEKSVEFGLPAMELEQNFMDLVKSYSKYETPPKFTKAVNLARSFAEKGEKTVIWASYINNVIALKNMLSDLNALEIFGGIPLKEEDEELASREKHIREFKTDPRVKVLVANPAACAESISLHKACHNAIYVDRTYNAGHLMQSMDRIHRIGLPKGTKTNYYMLITKGTIDERIDVRLKEKVKLLERLMDDDFSAVELDFTLDQNNNLVEGFERSAELDADFEDLIRNLGCD